LSGILPATLPHHVPWLHLEQLWQKSMNPGQAKWFIGSRPGPPKSMRKDTTSLKVVMDLPARGALRREINVYAKEKRPRI